MTLKLKKNKWSVRWTMSNHDAKHLLLRKRKQLCKAVQKSEPGKVRAVISSDVSTYLKMTYVSYYLDQIFRQRTDTTLYMNKDEREKLWQGMEYDGTWRMPLDQSEFDQMQTLKQVLIIVRTFKKLINHFIHKKEISQELSDLIDKIEYAIDGGEIIVGKHRVEVLNGVLSGWRWTALIDTLVNLIEVDMAKDLYNEVTNDTISLVDVNGQGDDDKFKIQEYKHCVGLWLAFESFNLKVNPGKFFVSKHRDEYLRRVYDRGIVTGYPARSVTSIMFRNPISPQEAVGSARTRENLTKWKLFCERLDMSFRGSWFEKMWMLDSKQGTAGMTEDVLQQWLDQDPVVGGLGWNGGELSDALIPTSALENKDNFKIESEGANEWIKFAESYGVPFNKAKDFIISTLNIPIKNRIPKWVKYIITDEKNLKTDLPYGLKTNIKGSVGVGIRVKMLCWALSVRWFPSLSRLKHTRYYTDWELEQPIRYVYKRPGRLIHGSGKRLLEPVDGISILLAQLSEKPDLVWKNTFSDLLKHKPRSWQRDFYAGRLKAVVPIVPGYGNDVVGSIAQSYMSTAINQYLLTSHPSLDYWYSLQRKIVKLTLRRVKDMRVRIVE